MKINSIYSHQDKNLSQISKLIQRDYEAVMKKTNIIVSALLPIKDPEILEKLQDDGIDLVFEDLLEGDYHHIYLTFFNPLINQIDVSTCYNSLTNPSYLVCSGPKDPLGCIPETGSNKDYYYNLAWKRDMDGMFIVEKRLKYETLSYIYSGMDVNKLGESVEYFRQLTRDQIVKNDLPLFKYDTHEGANCYTYTLKIFQRAFPDKPLILPKGTKLVPQMEKFFKSREMITDTTGHDIDRVYPENTL